MSANQKCKTTTTTPETKLYAKPFEHPVHGTMYSVTGLSTLPVTIHGEEFCETCMEVNPAAFDKLIRIQKRVEELRDELTASVIQQFGFFQQDTNDIFADSEKYTEEYLSEETLARGTVSASPELIFRRAMQSQLGGFIGVIGKTMGVAVAKGICKYVDPEGYAQYEGHSELDVDPATDPAYAGTCGGCPLDNEG